MGKKINLFSKTIKIQAEIFIKEREFSGWNDSWMPILDISERKNKIVIRTELPGVREKDISIIIQSNKVEFRGIKRESNFPGKVKYLRLERECGLFRRVVFLPKAVSTRGAEALLENGVLTLVLNKTGEIETENKKIKIHKPKE